jgi:hypothetical protein
LQTAALNFKLIKKIKDERFDEDLIHQYQLLIHIGFRDLQIGVIDDSENRMLLLEDYVFPSLSSQDDVLQILDQLFDGHPFLKAAFWKSIKISIKNNKYVQVPQALFLDEARTDYLRFNAYIEDDEEVFSVVNPKSKAVTVFAFPSALRTWLLTIYPSSKVTFMHQSAVLIEALTNFANYKKDNSLFIYVDRFKLHILSAKNGNLLYYNQFAIKQFSDYIRYIMLALRSLNLSQESSQVVLWGYIGKNSPHYEEFYKYVNNVVFGHRPKFLNFGYMFDEIQDHHFFDLYGMYLLENR